MRISQPDVVPVYQAQIGDFFVGRNCTLRLVGQHVVKSHGQPISYTCRFRSVSEIKVATIELFFTPDEHLPRVLTVAESFGLQTISST